VRTGAREAWYRVCLAAAVLVFLEALVVGDGPGLRRLGVAAVLLVVALGSARLLFLLERRRGVRGLAAAERGASNFGGVAVLAVGVVPAGALTGLGGLAFADRVAIAALLGLAIGRIGCLGAGCCWGAATTGRAGVPYPLGRPVERRVPLPALEAAAALAIAVAAAALAATTRSGVAFAAALLTYSGGRFALDFLRPRARGRLSPSQWLAAALAGAGCVWLAAALVAG
jgi:phosphatidylglycerol:prolipoprotein diacylglycerol transferase